MAKKTKIYFWLKLDNNFFKNLAVRALRKRAGGDTYLIIYQRLLLEALESNGTIEYQGLLEDLPSELALALDEKEEDVRTTIEYFKQAGLIQIGDDGSAFFEQVPMLIDQETNWSRYKRNQRKDSEIVSEKPQGLENVQPMSNQCPTDIDIEIKSKKELKKNKELQQELDIEEPSEVDEEKFIDKVANNLGRGLVPFEYDILNDYLINKKVSEELFLEAVKVAVANNVRKFNYIARILDNWLDEGITTVAQAYQAQLDFKARKSSKKKNSHINEDEAKRMQEKYGF